MQSLLDDLGAEVPLSSPLRRVVSLVPSITESIAATCPDRLVGATDWCTHPAGLEVARVRGTKNPDLDAIKALQPGLVVANKEENRELDVRRLREAGVAVWVTDIETVPQAIDSLRRLFVEAFEVDSPAWLDAAEAEWSGPLPEPSVQVAVAIWRDPWMVVGAPTFTDDLLARLGWANAFGSAAASHPSASEHAVSGHAVSGHAAGRSSRYPQVDLADLDSSHLDAVLLPDEPYVFAASDGPESFTHVPTVLCSGRLLTWYGPSLVGARETLSRLLVGRGGGA